MEPKKLIQFKGSFQFKAWTDVFFECESEEEALEIMKAHLGSKLGRLWESFEIVSDDPIFSDYCDEDTYYLTDEEYKEGE